MDRQVIVVGAGPTGLMLACELALMGVDVAIVERRPHGTTGESRAPGINARTMEVFAQRGLAETFLERGKRLPAVLFSGIPMMPGSDWPQGLILPQHETERILTERASELRIPIMWSSRLVHLVQREGAVEALVETEGTLTSLRAAYLAGCDGGHSAVRVQLGESFAGDDAVSHWIVADVELDAPPSERGVFGRNTRVGTYQISRTEPGWFRLSMMKVVAPADRSAPVTLEELREAMVDGLGTDYGLRRARWMSRFGDGFRQVTRYRHGRVFLVGDAAHTHSPIGGQGLNLGIQDAVNLGWKLAAVARGDSPESLLETYHEERHPVASKVLQLAKAQTALIKPGTQIDALRDVVSGMLETPAVARKLAGFLSGLDICYPWDRAATHPLVGRRMPNLPLQNGSDAFASLRTGRPVLFDFGGSPSLSNRWRARVNRVTAPPCAGWTDPVSGDFPSLSAAFVRPDGYVAWAESEPELEDEAHAALKASLEAWLG